MMIIPGNLPALIFLSIKLPAAFPFVSVSIVSVSLPAVGTPAWRRPTFRVLPDNRPVMNGRVIMEIEPYRRGSKQHVNRDARRRRPRYP